MPDVRQGNDRRSGRLAVTLTTALRLAGWLCGNAVGVLALPLLFLIALTGVDGEAVMTQLANFAAHYVDAGAARRGAFHGDVALLASAAFVAIGFLRFGSLVHALRGLHAGEWA